MQTQLIHRFGIQCRSSISSQRFVVGRALRLGLGRTIGVVLGIALRRHIGVTRRLLMSLSLGRFLGLAPAFDCRLTVASRAASNLSTITIGSSQ